MLQLADELLLAHAIRNIEQGTGNGELSLRMPIQSASASIIGSSHKKHLKNKQDAFRLYQSEEITVGVVCDGCGSCAQTEIGSALTAEFAVNYCANVFCTSAFDGQLLSDAICNFYNDLIRISGTSSPKEFARETLLTTVVGFVLTPSDVVVFTSGDGVTVVNNEINVIDQNDRPDFLGYNIYRNKNYTFDVKKYPRNEVKRLLIATDGLIDLWSDRNPSEVLDELFSRKDFFSDPAALSTFFAERTDLRDDTTAILLKL